MSRKKQTHAGSYDGILILQHFIKQKKCFSKIKNTLYHLELKLQKEIIGKFN